MAGDRVRRLRQASGLTQAELADRAQVSRQLVGAVEAGRHLPRVDAAVRLATALSVSVEELFDDGPREVVGVIEDPVEGALVRVGRVGNRLVCIPSDGSGEGWATADAQVHNGELELFEGERPAVIVAGCDPIIGLTSRLLEVTGGPRVMSIATASATATEILAAERSHAITVHGPETQLADVPTTVQRWHIARWQVGLAAPSSLPDGWVNDALAGKLPVIHREQGAGSQDAFERARCAAHGRVAPIRGPQAGGHAEAAWRAGTDQMVAVTIEPAALAYGLTFHPLETHTSEMWVASEHVDDPLVQAFMHELVGERVQRRLEAIGGYDLTDTGLRIVA